VGVWRWDNELNMGFVSEANYSEIFSAYFAIRDAIIIGAGLVVLLTFITTEGMRRYNNRHISTLALRDQIIDNSADGIVVIDRQSIIRIANPKVCELFGYALGELDGNNVACLIPSPSQEEHDKYVAKSALYGSRIFDRRRNLRGLRRDGSTFPIDLVVTKMDIADNEYFIGLIRDITEMIEKENQLLEARNRAQEALSIAENANNARSLFLSKMNHELRTPLNAILGFSDLLELDCEDPEALEHIHIIKSSGQHLLTLINDIVDWAKAESGRIQLELIPVNIAHIIEEACSDKRDILLEKKLTLTLDTHAINQYFILADPFRLKQAIDSLLQHAILFSQIETAIDIHFTCPDDVTAILTIHYLTDADKAFMNQALIDLFNNLDKVEAIEGSDIKLILARELIRLMGGQISIHHAENGETQIELTLSKANMTQNEEG
jgi:PAS domain S-box-containing protein